MKANMLPAQRLAHILWKCLAFISPSRDNDKLPRLRPRLRMQTLLGELFITPTLNCTHISVA